MGELWSLPVFAYLPSSCLPLDLGLIGDLPILLELSKEFISSSPSVSVILIAFTCIPAWFLIRDAE